MNTSKSIGPSEKEAHSPYQLLDTLPEKSFDNLTYLAASICNVPISLITLLDDDRQFFKSHYGIDADQTPIEESFCVYAIKNPSEPFIVTNARKDQRFRDNPLVTGYPHIVFYAGLPLVTPSGAVLGTLCVIDNKPRRLSNDKLNALKALADQVVQLFEFRKVLLESESSKVAEKASEKEKREEELNLLFESAPEIIAVISSTGNFIRANPAFCELTGFSEKELTSRKFTEFVHPDDLKKTLKEYQETITGERQANNFTNRYITRSGDYKWISWNSSDVFGEQGHVFAFGRDITQKKRLQLLLDNASKLARIGGWEVDLVQNTIYWSDMMQEIHEIEGEFEPTFDNTIQYYKEKWAYDAIYHAFNEAVENGKPWDLELPIVTAKGNKRWVRVIGQSEIIDGQCVKIYGSLQDIHQRKTIELKLQKAYKERNKILESIGDGFFTLDRDWKVHYWNKQAEKIIGKKRMEVIGMNLWKVFPGATKEEFYFQYKKAMESQKPVTFEELYKDLNIWFEVAAYPTETGLSVFFKDVSIRKKHEAALKKLNTDLENYAKKLEISNEELEQFAYVTSHDLQEPLRMISSFLSLLEKKYKDELDDKAKQYIHFAVDGAKRMRHIILDLLEFSRIGRGEDVPEKVDLNEIIEDFCVLRSRLIEEHSASVIWNDLPVINSYKTPLTQVFHNLLDNALKYSRKGVKPKVKISAEDKGNYWQIAVKDNGIGIEKEYYEKIFLIFQRLHGREEHQGTGIGLSVVKKILQHIGGKIWVESELNKGSTFYLTLNKQ